MLKNNGGCELPCWWGITPGQMAWQAAKDIFTSQGIKWYYENELHFDPPLAERLVRYRVDLYLAQQAGIVQSVEVQSEVFGDPQSNHFAQDWQRYSPAQVLTRYGVPSQIQLSLSPITEPGAIMQYGLTIAYDNLGFYIHYIGPAADGKAKTRACPIWKQVTSIDLKLQVPEPGVSVLPPISPEDKPFVHTLEEATGMSLDTFYQTFKRANSQACLDLPVTWP